MTESENLPGSIHTAIISVLRRDADIALQVTLMIMPEAGQHIRILISWLRVVIKTTAVRSYTDCLSGLLRIAIDSILLCRHQEIRKRENPGFSVEPQLSGKRTRQVDSFHDSCSADSSSTS
ncbi:hypothetical protein BDR07DRAFT_1416459, partial [Suillus spraguei]